MRLSHAGRPPCRSPTARCGPESRNLPSTFSVPADFARPVRRVAHSARCGRDARRGTLSDTERRAYNCSRMALRTSPGGERRRATLTHHLGRARGRAHSAIAVYQPELWISRTYEKKARLDRTVAVIDRRKCPGQSACIDEDLYVQEIAAGHRAEDHRRALAESD
jgi:hypothetical protein